jgi:glycosyltransferase involved in cell wall biosynthesis
VTATTISIVIPALNAAETIGAQLSAIAAQDVDQQVEVIVADNGSVDGTRRVAEAFAGRLRLSVVDASRRVGPGAARNVGVQASSGTWLAFCDADDVVLTGWLDALGRCVGAGRVAVGSFQMVGSAAAVVPSDWQESRRELPRYLGQVPLTYSSNLGVTRRDFDRVGGFDEGLRCGEDADLGIRLIESGCEVVFCPDARVVMRNRSDARSQFRQFLQYGRWDVAVFRKHRGGALRRPPLSAALRDYASLVVHLPRLLNPARRRSWIVTAGLRGGRLVGSVRERTFLP